MIYARREFRSRRQRPPTPPGGHGSPQRQASCYLRAVPLASETEILDKFKAALFAGNSHLVRSLIDECCERALLDVMYQMRAVIEDAIRVQEASLVDLGGESLPGSN